MSRWEFQNIKWHSKNQCHLSVREFTDSNSHTVCQRECFTCSLCKIHMENWSTAFIFKDNSQWYTDRIPQQVDPVPILHSGNMKGDYPINVILYEGAWTLLTAGLICTFPIRIFNCAFSNGNEGFICSILFSFYLSIMYIFVVFAASGCDMYLQNLGEKFNFLVGKHKGETLLWRPRHRW